MPDLNADPVHPLTIEPGPGASLWFVTDGGTAGGRQAIRLDRGTESQYPCVGRDFAVLSGLLDHVRRLMEVPDRPKPFPWLGSMSRELTADRDED